MAARLSIVDGTHIALLPLPAKGGNGHCRSGGGKTKKRRSNDNKSQLADYDDWVIAVPVLPLSLVWKTFGRECISPSGDHAIGAADNDPTDDDDDDGTAADQNNSELVSYMETIRLHASDLSNADYRFVHSASLVDESSSSSSSTMRVVSCEDGMDEASLVLGHDMVVEVYLPSSFASATCSSHECKDDECNLYGGEHYDIPEDDLDHDGNNACNNSASCAFEVHGAGSCLVADFLGVAGHEQALVLPRFDATLLLPVWDGDARQEESILRKNKLLLQNILRNSFLTDGQGILLSKHLKQSMASTTNADDRIVFHIPPLVSTSKLTGGAILPFEFQSNNDATASLELITQDGDSTPPHEQSNTALTGSSEPIHEENAEPTKSQEDPDWLDAIAQTVGHRLAREVEGSGQLERSAEARSKLVYQGRKTLHAASRPVHLAEAFSSSDPEAICLRYGTRPRTSVENSCGGISVVLDLELDVMMDDVLSTTGSKETSADKNESLSSHALHDFHLSCSLANGNVEKSSSSSTTTTTPESIRTVSGVVPTLQSGDCITILASAHLIDLKVDTQEISTIHTLDISIQALWVDALSETQNDGWNPANKPRRRAAVLCLLRLPIDTLFLAPPTSPAPRSGHWIQNEINFASGSNGSAHHLYPIPSAIFEYRQPRTLTVDTSGEVNFAQDSKMWKELVTNLNECIGGNSFIDLYCKKGEPRLKVVVFGSNPEERAATVKLFLRNLPESAKITIDDPDESENVKTLLMSLQKEADALKRHRALSSKNIHPDFLVEMLALQRDTDGVASTIKRGWA